MNLSTPWLVAALGATTLALGGCSGMGQPVAGLACGSVQLKARADRCRRGGPAQGPRP